MRSFPVVIAIVLATLSSGCLFGPSVECELSLTLTQADCDHAVQVALPKLADETVVTRLLVRAGCPRYKHCLPSTMRAAISVEVTFEGTERLGEILVVRSSWDAGEVFYPSIAPSNS